MSKNYFTEVAERAAREAGRFLLENLGKMEAGDIEEKRASDYVTRIDRESETIIIEIIKETFGSHLFLTEESIRDESTDEYRWIIDPLDGTTNYIHGYPVFSVSIALQYGREIIAGVVFDPVRDEVFSAERGAGAYLNGERLDISKGGVDVRTSLIATGFPFREKQIIGRYLDLFRNIFLGVSDLRRAGSAAIDLAWVASGRCDGFFEIGLSPWDVAAGSLLILEAGGVVTDFKGGNRYVETGNIVAGPEAVQEFLLKAIERAGMSSLY
jgi:myo-inositol-1(or 4)-monophosphatase